MPAIAVLSPAGAQTSTAVFAGESGIAHVGASFPLTGIAEGFQGATTAAWSGPAACAIANAASLVTTASCSAPGTATFTLSVTDGSASATDTVTHVIIRETTYTHVAASGHVLAGGPDEAISYQENSGDLDGATVEVPFDVPTGALDMRLELTWGETRNDFDMDLSRPGGYWYSSTSGRTHGIANRIVMTVQNPVAGTWSADVKPFAVVDDTWSLTGTMHAYEGMVELPLVTAQGAEASVGDAVTLTAVPKGGAAPYTLAWETASSSHAFDDGTGTTITFPFTESTMVKVKVTDANGLERVSTAFVREAPPLPTRSITVVGVIDSKYNPYHFDFLGSQHPWNRDADPSNDFDFTADPSTYIPGFPGAEPILITMPANDSVRGDDLKAADASEWAKLKSSSGANPKLYWFPGTKIVGAADIQNGGFYSSNSDHGTRSAASAAGNWHGSCQECVFVLISGLNTAAVDWASKQPWIDVVTNSWMVSSTIAVRDGIYLGSTSATKAGSERGQTMVFAAGNGLANMFLVPEVTYTSSFPGPDWMVTVGAVTPSAYQSYTGSAKPVDISSVGSSYPSTGGNTVNGTGTHSGTSNAAPVTAGYFAKVIQEARQILGDTDNTVGGGIVASGTPVACGTANPDCPLGDGILTKTELDRLVYHNVLPSSGSGVGTTMPSTLYSYAYQGHGVLRGHTGPAGTHANEWGQMVAAAIGASDYLQRPTGERDWMIADTSCRETMWGSWTGSMYSGEEQGALTVTHAWTQLLNAVCSGP